MPKYVISSDSPISARPITKPEWEFPGLPDWRPETGLPGVPDTGLPGRPEFPGFPERPGHGLPPMLPPKDEWPPLPPWLQPGVGLPIPPTPDFPMVPIPPTEGGGPDEPEIWPPLPGFPGLPDFSGKTLALALVYVSRHVAQWHWVVIDNESAKNKVKEVLGAIKDKLPAGGVGGTPPQRPGVPGAQPR